MYIIPNKLLVPFNYSLSFVTLHENFISSCYKVSITNKVINYKKHESKISAQFKVLSQHLPGGSKESQGNISSSVRLR